MKKIVLSIGGMTCSACSNGLEKFLSRQKGVENVVVDLVLANAAIEYDENVLAVEDIEKMVIKAGFESLGEFGNEDLLKKEPDNRKWFVCFSVAAVVVFGLMAAHFLGMVQGGRFYDYLMCLFAVVFLGYGSEIIVSGYKNMVHRTPNMDTLVTLGALTSFIYSICVMVFGNGHLYFETVIMIIYFVKLGRFVEGQVKDKTKEAIGKLVLLTPDKAIVKTEKGTKIVTLDEVRRGDVLVAKAGDKIAVDGDIVAGKAHFGMAFVTGESAAVVKQRGDKVLAGSVNYDGYVEYRAEKIGKDSTVSEIVRLVVNASSSKPKIAGLADRLAGWFVPMVIGTAVLVLVWNICAGLGVENALIKMVSVLVVACPCALGLATPLAVVVAQGCCLRDGIVIKKGSVLEKVGQVEAVVFDKTGILTYGEPKIAKMFNYSTMSDAQILAVAAAIEKKSGHPIAKAFEKVKTNLETQNWVSIDGMGIEAEINGQKVVVGNDKMLQKWGIKNDKTDLAELRNLGGSLVFLAIDGKLAALFVICDIVRWEAKEAVGKLLRMNLETIMLTGDNIEVAQKIAKEVGITNICAGVLPKDKAGMVQRLRQENKCVMMCGDGINDSPALAESDIGVSIGSGTEIAVDAADVVLVNENLNNVERLIKVGKKALRIIKQNLFWAFVYNILMIPMAAGVFANLGLSISPMMACGAMVLSSIMVVINSLRLYVVK